MGHHRLGRLPRTRKWQDVVALLGSGADTPRVAAATLTASERGFDEASTDPALVHSFWLLTQLPLCARRQEYVAELHKVGVPVSGAPTVMDLVGGLSDSVDEHVRRTGGRTDLGEMAQMGAAETVASVLRQRTTTLFGADAEDVRRELGRISTPKNFSTLARQFFARLTERYLAYFLSRELSNQRPSVSANVRFREALALHCRQASKIVEKYAADWYSKKKYEGEITPALAGRFVARAMTKLVSELQKGAEGGGA